MFFNSLQFAVFFALVWSVVVALALAASRRRPDDAKAVLATRNAFLLAASYVFYGFWDWRFLSLIVVSTLVDFFCGRKMAELDPSPANEARRKRLLVLSLVTNLGLLGFFKYFGFFVSSAVASLAAVGVETNVQVLSVVLPVGISFYTFQTLSYTIDIYRRQMEPEPRLVNFAAYVAFFPQLVAGPIERARKLVPQFRQPTRLTRERLHTGFLLIAWGLFKKVVIADNVAKVADVAFGLSDPNGLQSLLGAYAFAVQIYCDFSGYTDIARGLARTMGFELSLNFNLPYVAQNPSDFWRRWHISLSSWLRDYLYIPLGGNRGTKERTYINLMLTMVLGGLWHGAAWTFVFWGAFHGALLGLYRLATPWVMGWLRLPTGWRGVLCRFANGLFFFHLVCISWILFRADSLSQAFDMIASIGGVLGADVHASVRVFATLEMACFVTSLLVVVQAIQHLRDDHLFVLKLPAPVRAVLYALGALCFLYLGEFGGDAFIYFQF